MPWDEHNAWMEESTHVRRYAVRYVPRDVCQASVWERLQLERKWGGQDDTVAHVCDRPGDHPPMEGAE